ncbi:olfactory receptor 8G17-like [Pleurodeles waltl]|uniref:olfactory receptor 8G17-like n=1 Tax=Pleurodeles waltl TaxID=8319 RepID=UPI003709AD7C
MNKENLSSTEYFLIVGFSDVPHLQIPLFVAFLMAYLLTLVGNLLILITVYLNSHLHTPMYFFLANLSFIDIWYVSVFFRKLLANFFLEGIQVSLMECLLQLFFFLVIVTVEFLLLTVMAYDRYVAICNPLRYTSIMNKAVCMWLTAGSWGVGLINAIPHIGLLSKLSFCNTHIINHFFCDLTALLKMSCSDTFSNETCIYINGVVIVIMSFVFIIISYFKITVSILKIQSKSGKEKAFSTCASHLIVVILFYVSLCSTYMRPTSTYSIKDNKIMSLSYAVITPLCNPIVYSFKNAEFKNALRKFHWFQIVAGHLSPSSKSTGLERHCLAE